MKKRLMLILPALLVLYLIIIAVGIWRYGNVDEKTPCDVAIVLGAAANSQGVSPVYAERINHGIWLYNHDFVDHIIMTGGVTPGNNFSEASKAKEYALSKGVPDDAIILEEESKITQENLENSKEIMARLGLKTCIVVSDPLHMKRAMLIAKDYGMDAYSSPTPSSRYITLKTKLPFLLREEFYYVGYNIFKIFGVEYSG